ncbi:MAG: GTPase RsgA, partial [Chitinophagaceae bacterium]|nr:GTPase RsgA [Chitinophagaceae bacterium]
MQGVVYKSTGSWYTLKDKSGKMWNGRLKGLLKLDDITSTNPIAVGDIVDFEVENEFESTALITSIHDRKNYINRQSPRAKHQQHIVASNVDQLLLLATLKEPRTSQGFIDRFIVACEMYHVPAIIVFNKADIYKKKEMQQYESLKQVYESTGYSV